MEDKDLKVWNAKPLVAGAIAIYMLLCCVTYVLASPHHPHHPFPMHTMYRPHMHHVSHHHHSDAVLFGILGATAATIIFADNVARQNQQKTIVLREVPKNRVFYWCESEREFFPTVRSCPEGWRKVVAE